MQNSHAPRGLGSKPEATWDTADAPPTDRPDPIPRVVQPVLQLLAAKGGPQYQCPGESDSISRAVHLSRQARYYPACRNCPHADCSPLPTSTVSIANQPINLPQRKSISNCAVGLRGIYLNEIGRTDAERLSMAIAQQLWRVHPRRGMTDDDAVLSTRTEAHGPEVVVGRDSRPSSADIACGVVRGLRRMGCRITELGVVNRSTIDFAVYHLRTAGGLFVTGAGGDASITGLDVLGRDVVPWSQPGRLDDLGAWRSTQVDRVTRQGGTVRTYDLAVAERTELQRYLHGLRRGRIGIVIDNPRLSAEAADWFAGSGCDPVLLSLRGVPFGAAELTVDARRSLRAAVQDQGLSLVARIADDGRCVQLFDELARPIEPSDWFVRLAEAELAEQGGGRIVVPTQISAAARGRLRAHGAELELVGDTEEAVVGGMVATQALLAADGAGRVWLGDHYPLCHGFVTLARLWRVAMASDQPLRHWAA